MRAEASGRLSEMLTHCGSRQRLEKWAIAVTSREPRHEIAMQDGSCGVGRFDKLPHGMTRDLFLTY